MTTVNVMYMMSVYVQAHTHMHTHKQMGGLVPKIRGYHCTNVQ